MTELKPNDPSGLNPNGAARRRLLATLGGTAAGALLSVQWTRPMVRLGSLPAHAVATTSLCHIDATLELGVGNAGSLSASIIMGGGGGVSTLTTGEGSNLSLTASFQPTVSGEYAASWSVSHSVTADITTTGSGGVSCCTAVDSGSGTIVLLASESPGTEQQTLGTVIVNDDATCNVPDSP